MDNISQNDRFDDLLAELKAIRREGQEIRKGLEQLLGMLNRIESRLTGQGGPAQVPVSPGVEKPLSARVEVETAAQDQEVTVQGLAHSRDIPGARTEITPGTRTGAKVCQRHYRFISIIREKLNRLRVLLKKVLFLNRIRYAFSLQKGFTVFLICLVVYGVSVIGMFDWVEILFSNMRYAFKGESLPSSKIALVVVDTKSIQELGPFGKSWRQYHGRVLKHLADDGVRGVGFDFSFSSSSEYNQAFIEGIRYARGKGIAVVVANQYDERNKTFSPTIAPVKDSVSAVGHAYLRKDRVTNLVRWVPLQLEEVWAEGAIQLRKSYLSLAAQLATLLGTDLPTTDAGNNYLTIQFRGKNPAFKTYSYAQVYKNAFPPGSFKDKLVLIGTTLPRHRDFYDVPGRSHMPGVEIHAHALHTILTGNIREMGPAGLAVAILSSALITGMVFAYGNRSLRTIGLPSLLALYWVASIYYFLQKPPVELNLVYPSLSLALTWGILSLQEKIATRTAFTRTIGLPEKVIKRLESDPDFREGEARKLLTILESDIVSYSVFSSQNPAGHVRALIAEYSAAIEKVIYKHGGYVNKYIGDAVLAIFGYPMEEKDSARRAVRAAWEMQQVLAELVQGWKQENKNCFNRIRIGINHGYVSISYLGKSKKQLDVLGDNVDLAARLESAAGKYDGAALLSPSTYEEVKDIIAGKRVAVELKNRPDVKDAYTLEALVS